MGGVGEHLLIDKKYPSNIGFKATAVFNNFHGVVDSSESDDHATTERLMRSQSYRARDILDVPSLKIVHPIGTVGLTLLQLDEIEDFLFKK